MNALFLIFHGFNPANGITKKIHYQMAALKACGVDVKLCYLQESNGEKSRMIDNLVLCNYGSGVKGKILKRIEFMSLIKYILNKKIQFVYMRFDHNANPFTVWMAYKLRKAGVKIVMEIPTYPYDQEYKGINRYTKLLVDKCFRNLLARQIFRIVTFSNDENIFGVSTIRISNGIDFSLIKLRKTTHDTNLELHLIGVAEIHYWHGFDRLLNGLINYYRTNPNYNVYFHIVGYFFGDKERHDIISLIQQNDIEKYVILHGPQHGSELDRLFEKADVAIGSLARHRSGITHIKTLKNREYAARGFRFIYSETDSDFDNKPYVMKVPANESPIDIQQIISFSKQESLRPVEIRNSISSLSWTEQMRKVIELSMFT